MPPQFFYVFVVGIWYLKLTSRAQAWLFITSEINKKAQATPSNTISGITCDHIKRRWRWIRWSLYSNSHVKELRLLIGVLYVGPGLRLSGHSYQGLFEVSPGSASLLINTVCGFSLGRRPACVKDGIISGGARSKTPANILPRIAKNNSDPEVCSAASLGATSVLFLTSERRCSAVSTPTDTEIKIKMT